MNLKKNFIALCLLGSSCFFFLSGINFELGKDSEFLVYLTFGGLIMLLTYININTVFKDFFVVSLNPIFALSILAITLGRYVIIYSNNQSSLINLFMISFFYSIIFLLLLIGMKE